MWATMNPFFNTEIALNASVLALEGLPNPGPVNWGNRLPEHHATSPDTSRPETEDALETFEQSLSFALISKACRPFHAETYPPI